FIFLIVRNDRQSEYWKVGLVVCENIPNELKESTEVNESFDVPLVKKLLLDDKLEKKIIVLTDAKIEFVKAKQQEKLVRKPVKYAEMYSGEERLKLKELMKLCTKLSDRVLDLEKTKTAQAKKIANLEKSVKKLERKRRSRTSKMNLFKIGKIKFLIKKLMDIKFRGGLLGLKDFLVLLKLLLLVMVSTAVLLKLLLLVMVSTAAKVNAASEYGYYCLKSMFEEKLQLLVNAD
nr:hypothetical protein [Tanacetum cinerariifolium]